MQGTAAIQSADPTPQRRGWSYTTRAISALTAFALVTAIILLMKGRDDWTTPICMLTFLFTCFVNAGASSWWNRSGPETDRLNDARALNVGFIAMMAWLLVSYAISIGFFGRDTPITLNRTTLEAALWVSGTMVHVVRLAYRVWCAPPPSDYRRS